MKLEGALFERGIARERRVVLGQKDLLDTYGTFMKGIWEPCERAVKEGVPLGQAKELVLKDPRVASRAKTMAGFDSNIGKYTSLAYLEAEKEAF